jgi:hypothetical protein
MRNRDEEARCHARRTHDAGLRQRQTGADGHVDRSVPRVVARSTHWTHAPAITPSVVAKSDDYLVDRVIQTRGLIDSGIPARQKRAGLDLDINVNHAYCGT